jgi:hypothetical protein
MASVESITGDHVRDIMTKKPEIMERLIGITMDRGTLKSEHWIDVHPGRQKLDFCFQDTEGKHYVVKIALKEKPLNAVRHPNIWQKRWAEINKLDIEQVVPVLIIDEETVNTSPRNKKDLDAFSHVITIQYKIADIAKEL